MYFFSSYRLQTKYHPNKVADNRSQYLQNIKNRLNVFDWFHKRSKLEDVPLVVSEGETIVQLMDKAVILMEGGNERDFQSLDMPLVQLLQEQSSPHEKKQATVEKDKDSKPSPSSQSSEGMCRCISCTCIYMCVCTVDSKGLFNVSELSPEQQKLANQAKQYRQDIQPHTQDEVHCTCASHVAVDTV